MIKKVNAEKIYCYVDESGQDTMGRFFIVVAIIIEEEKEKLTKELEQIEEESHKINRKWTKTKDVARRDYIDAVLNMKTLKNNIYFQVFRDSKLYQDLTSLLVARAMNRHIERKHLGQYKATVVIDGLRKTQIPKISKVLRDLGIKIYKVRGIKDESDPIIRLADSIAGFIRETELGDKKFRLIKKEKIRARFINEI